jgi:hypothetical protein
MDGNIAASGIIASIFTASASHPTPPPPPASPPAQPGSSF